MIFKFSRNESLFFFPNGTKISLQVQKLNHEPKYLHSHIHDTTVRNLIACFSFHFLFPFPLWDLCQRSSFSLLPKKKQINIFQLINYFSLN